MAATHVDAQPLAPPDSSSHANMLQLGFERIVNTFAWDAGAGYEIGNRIWRASLTERFQRTLQHADRGHIKDEHSLRIDAEHRLASSLKAVGTFASYLFTDNLTPGLNELTSYKALAGISWTPVAELTIIPLLGYGFDNQQGMLDHGFSWSGSLSLRNVQLGDSYATGEASASQDDLSPRHQHEYRLLGNLSSFFGDAAHNLGSISVRRTRRDFYLPAIDSSSVHPLESRTELAVALADRLDYKISRRVELSGTIDASQRSIDKRQRNFTMQSASPAYDSNIEDFRLNASATLRYRGGGSGAEVRVDVNERSENHSLDPGEGEVGTTFARQQRIEEQKNNTISQTQIAVAATHNLGERDTIAMAVSGVKMVYNTPSSANYDDRDELFLLAGARWTRRFSPWLLTAFNADAQLRHTVFISGERSANNTWNRVFRVSPEIEFRLGNRFVSRNRGEVTANYTVYDFESMNNSLRSFSLRQYSFADSSTLRLGTKMFVAVALFLRKYEQGEIRWSAFTMRPLSLVDEQSAVLSLSYETTAGSTMVGFRLFRQIRFRYHGLELERESVLRHYGPLCRIQLRASAHATLVADGWYQIMDLSGTAPKSTPNVSLRLVWNL